MPLCSSRPLYLSISKFRYKDQRLPLAIRGPVVSYIGLDPSRYQPDIAWDMAFKWSYNLVNVRSIHLRKSFEILIVEILFMR